MADTNCGYWRYLGNDSVPTASGKIKPIDPNQLWPGVTPVDTEASESHSVPRILTRCEKGQALTHLEMDFNLASLFHKLNTSSVGAPWTPEENASGSGSGVDVYFERHKPTREEEMEGLFATFSYAPVVNGSQSVIQNPFQTIKIQHTTDEIRYKLSNERIPGTLDIEEDFHVTGSIFTQQNAVISGNVVSKKDTTTKTLHVESSSVFAGDVRVAGTQSIDGDLYIVGNLYVNGVLFGNISRPEYNTPDYAESHSTLGPVEEPVIPQLALAASPKSNSTKNSSTKFYTQDEVDQMLANLREELLAEIHGQTQG